MNFWKRLFQPREEKRELRLTDADGWRTLFGLSTAAGVTVTPESALSHPAVLGAVRLLAELTASLPLVVYERRDGSKQRAEGHPVYRLLHEQPNPIQTPFAFKETTCLHLLLFGNSYVLPEWGTDGRPAALWPIHPGKMTQEQDTGGAIRYKLTLPAGVRTMTPDEIIHVTMLSLDGLTGRSPVQIAREAIGAALAAEEYAAGYFGNAARPSGVLKTPGILDPDAAKRLKESWQQAYGRGKQGVAVLEDGLEFQPVSGNAQESQLIESRQHAMRALAAALRIPPHLLDPTARGTYSNVETQSLEFLTFSLQPFLTRIEEALTLKLFTPSERQRFFCEFLTDGLLRADTRTRYTAYQAGIQSGFLTVNEVRQRENLPPLPEPVTPPAAEAEREHGNTAPGRIKNTSGNISLSDVGQIHDRVAEHAPVREILPELEQGQAGEVSESGHVIMPAATNFGNSEAVRTTSKNLEVETRSKKRRIQDEGKTKIEAAARRVITREKEHILALAEKHLGNRDAALLESSISDYYQDTGWIAEEFSPAFSETAHISHLEAAGEVGASPWDDSLLSEFLAAFLAAYVARHAGISLATLQPALRAGSEGAILEALDQTLAEMEATRPGKIAVIESVALANETALRTYQQAGITKIKWQAGAGACSFCRRLSGKTVGIGEPFIAAGESIPGPEGDMSRKLTARQPRIRPPIHLGCSCTLAPVKE